MKKKTSDERVTLELVVCLAGKEYNVSTIPGGPEAGKLGNLNKELLHLNSEGRRYLPVLELGQVDMPQEIFTRGLEYRHRSLLKYLRTKLYDLFMVKYSKIK